MSVARSFDSVFAAEFDSLHAYLARRVGTSAAEELTAETFAIAHRRWGDLDPTRPARPWLYGSERRMLRAYARTGLDREVAEDSVTPERLDAQAARPALAEALAGLRRQERDVLLLWAWAELSDVEIADSLGLPLGTVKSRLSRARQQMRNRLDAIGQVEVETMAPTEERR